MAASLFVVIIIDFVVYLVLYRTWYFKTLFKTLPIVARDFDFFKLYLDISFVTRRSNLYAYELGCWGHVFDTNESRINGKPLPRHFNRLVKKIVLISLKGYLYVCLGVNWNWIKSCGNSRNTATAAVVGLQRSAG